MDSSARPLQEAVVFDCKRFGLSTINKVMMMPNTPTPSIAKDKTLIEPVMAGFAAWPGKTIVKIDMVFSLKHELGALQYMDDSVINLISNVNISYRLIA